MRCRRRAPVAARRVDRSVRRTRPAVGASVRQGTATTTATLWQPVELEPEIRAELVLQPRARRRHADALLQRRQRVSDRPTPSSRTSIHSLSCSRRAEMSMWPGPLLLGDAVLDRVLDERLQEQGRHERVERLGLDVEPHDQAIGEARLLDLEVLRQEIELRLQRDFAAAPMFSSVIRSRSLRRISVRSAASTSRCISAEMACSVLKRKCGWSCCCSVPHLRFDELRLELRGRAARGPATRGSRGRRGSGPRWPSRSSSPSRSSGAPLAGPRSTRGTAVPGASANHHWTPAITGCA